MTDLTAEAIREIRDAGDNVANHIYVPVEFRLVFGDDVARMLRAPTGPQEVA